MKKRYVLVLGVLALAAVLFARPAMMSAAAEPVAAVEQTTAVTTDGNQPSVTPAAETPAPANQDAQKLVNACTDAHNLPTAEQRTEAMNKLMNDPNLVGKMNQIMNDPKLAGQMTQFMNSPEGRSAIGSMMSGWRNGQTATGTAVTGTGNTTTTGSFGCH